VNSIFAIIFYTRTKEEYKWMAFVNLFRREMQKALGEKYENRRNTPVFRG